MAIYFDFVIDGTASVTVGNRNNPSIMAAIYFFCTDFINKAFDKIEDIDQQFGVTMFYGKEDAVESCCFTKNNVLFTDNQIYFKQGFNKAKAGSGDTVTGEDNIVGGMEHSCRKLRGEKGNKIMIVLSDLAIKGAFALGEQCPCQYVALLIGDTSKKKHISIPLVDNEDEYDPQKAVYVYDIKDLCDMEKRESIMDKIIDGVSEMIC